MQHTLSYQSAGRGTLDITADINRILAQTGIDTGLCHVFIRHTSASLMICENADAAVRGDVERWLAQAVRDGDPMFEHDQEGDDDMSGHIRSILTGMDLTVPITDGQLNLGVWQGIYLYEHRYRGRTRDIVITALAAG
ncbi:MAG TPA: secondary thiamine-phosphate synthase enzyme YjbQ [Salinisphaeraceae bacterium]|nr:secondary thiamine-phosphate synthase enzyme YjbQ [Salinisphaeraceae bacterium]